MKFVTFLLIFLLGSVFHVASAATTNAVTANKDSVSLFKQVMTIHLTHPELAFHMLDSMEENHLKPISQINVYRGLVYGSQDKYRLASMYIEKALQDDMLQQVPVIYLQAMSCGVAAYQGLEKHKVCLRLLRKGLDFARQQNNVTAEGQFLFTVGKVLYQLGDKKQAHEYFQQAVHLAENADGMLLKPYLSYFYGELCAYYIEEKRYEQALIYCQKREKLIHYIAQNRVPQGYVDQQYAYLYSKEAAVLAKMGRKKEADASFHKFLKTDASKQPILIDAYAAFDLAMHRYHELIHRIKPSMHTVDTVTSLFADRLHILAQAYSGLGEYDKAYLLQCRREVILDSLMQQKQMSDIAELATIFHLKEKDLLIQQQKSQLVHNRMMHSFLAGGLVLLALLLWFSLYHARTVKAKNRLLVKKINSLYHYQREVDQLKQCLHPHNDVELIAVSESKVAVSEETDSGAAVEAQPKEKTATQDVASTRNAASLSLFKRLDHTIKEEKLYLNPNLTRQDLSDYFSIDKILFSRLLQEHLGQTLPQYLNELRIRHAVLLMQSKPNYTLQAIAEESGYTNLRQFQRAFKAVHGMTPSEYKAATL